MITSITIATIHIISANLLPEISTTLCLIKITCPPEIFCRAEGFPFPFVQQLPLQCLKSSIVFFVLFCFLGLPSFAPSNTLQLALWFSSHIWSSCRILTRILIRWGSFFVHSHSAEDSGTAGTADLNSNMAANTTCLTHLAHIVLEHATIGSSSIHDCICIVARPLLVLYEMVWWHLICFISCPVHIGPCGTGIFVRKSCASLVGGREGGYVAYIYVRVDLRAPTCWRHACWK